MIVLVGAAVIFLSNVFRQAKTDREQAERRANLPPRRRDANTERFLEEINRRRQQSSGQSKSPPPVRPATLTPSPKPSPRREPPVRKVIPKAEKPRLDRPASRPISSRAVIGEMLEVVAADKPAIPMTLAPEPLAPSGAAASARPSTAQTFPRLVSPVLRQLLPFLQSRQTLRAGFVLYEILGPPRCRQKGRVMKTLAQSNNQHNQS